MKDYLGEPMSNIPVGIDINPADETPYICPICGKECEEVYYNIDHTFVGCDVCISWEGAEYAEIFARD